MNAIHDITKERERQINEEGWTFAHDDKWDAGQLALAAACYAAPNVGPVNAWPFSSEWWKPKDRRSNLVRAAALLVAEIDRLDRIKKGGDA